MLSFDPIPIEQIDLADDLLECQEEIEISEQFDKRVSYRKAAIWRCEISTETIGSMKGKTANISEHGLMLRVPRQIKPNTILHVKVRSFHGGIRRYFAFLGEVKHCSLEGEHFNVGVKITQTKSITRRFLKKYSQGRI